MIFHTVWTFGLLALTGMAKGSRDAYDTVCMSKDGRIEEHGSGRILYRCNRRLPEASMIGTLSAPTPQSCVENCDANSQCSGSQWLYGSQECRLFSVGDAAIEVQRGSVVIIPIGEEMGNGDLEYTDDDVALRECQTSYDDCTRNEQRLEEELRQCRAAQGTAEEEARLNEELDVCENSRLSLQQQLRECEASQGNLMTVVTACPGKDGQTLRQGKGTFKFNCKVRRTGEVLRTTGHGFEMCLQACASNSQCKATNYWYNKPVSQRCEMFKGPSPGYTSTTEKVVAALLTARH